MSRRMILLALGLCLLYGMLFIRLACLHLGKTETIRPPSPYALKLPATRGSIYDRHGPANPLATVLPTRLVFVDPGQVPDSERMAVATELGRLLNREIREMEDLLAETHRRYVPLAHLDDETRIRSVQTNVLFQGRVGLQPAQLRHYPLGRQLCHVLGFVNREQVGSAGIESLFNRYLTGVDGEIFGEADARRIELRERRQRLVPPRHGANIELTIDQTIQHHAEVALDRAMEQHQAAAAWTIVMHCRTGEILAMASRPDAHPAEFTRYPLETWRNRAISTNFEPGSTLKALTIAAALNERVISTNDVIECEQGVWHYAGRPLRDQVRGPADITTILQKSSNIGTAKIALKLGNRALEAYLRLAGFGRPTGIDLPGEEAGILDPARSWPAIKITRVAIGQGIATTALQMISLYSALANDGQRMRPRIVRRILSPEGELLLERRPEPVHAPLVHRDVARQMTAMLETVTHPGGTGRRAAIPGYRVAGKTGTAQIAVPGGYSSTDFIASFAGFFPVEDPRIAIIVVVERPRPLTGGGAGAAPVFAEIALQTARYLDLPTTDRTLEPLLSWHVSPSATPLPEDPIP